MNTVQLLPVWREALKNFIATNPKPGDVIKREWLWEQFGIAKPVTAQEAHDSQLRFLQEFCPFRDELLVEHRIDLRPVIGVGFAVIPPGEQTRHAIEKGTKKMANVISSMAKSVAFVKTEALSESERREHTDGMAKVASIQSMFSRRQLLRRV